MTFYRNLFCVENRCIEKAASLAIILALAHWTERAKTRTSDLELLPQKNPQLKLNNTSHNYWWYFLRKKVVWSVTGCFVLWAALLKSRNSQNMFSAQRAALSSPLSFGEEMVSSRPNHSISARTTLPPLHSVWKDATGCCVRHMLTVYHTPPGPRTLF